jgi:glutamate-1-semialdehyde aminotransferase
MLSNTKDKASNLTNKRIKKMDPKIKGSQFQWNKSKIRINKLRTKGQKEKTESKNNLNLDNKNNKSKLKMMKSPNKNYNKMTKKKMPKIKNSITRHMEDKIINLLPTIILKMTLISKTTRSVMAKMISKAIKTRGRKELASQSTP